MIESKELRIGNWVTDEFYDSLKAIIKVESIDSKGINLSIEDDENFAEIAETWIIYEYKFKQLHGIPLTEEILLKCGFVEGVDKWFNMFYYTDNKEAIEMFAISFNLVSNRLCIYEVDMEDTCIFTRKKVQYLHQLQNLYYALTNEELNVEL